ETAAGNGEERGRSAADRHASGDGSELLRPPSAAASPGLAPGGSHAGPAATPGARAAAEIEINGRRPASPRAAVYRQLAVAHEISFGARKSRERFRNVIVPRQALFIHQRPE